MKEVATLFLALFLAQSVWGQTRLPETVYVGTCSEDETFTVTVEYYDVNDPSYGEIVKGLFSIRTSKGGEMVFENTSFTEFTDGNNRNVPYHPGAIRWDTFSQKMFDADDRYEIMIFNKVYEFTEYLNGNLVEQGGGIGNLLEAYSYSLLQGNSSAVFFSFNPRTRTRELIATLPGNTPEYDRFQYKMSNWSTGSSGAPDTIYVERTTRDTVYLAETISRIDTVREIITERIFTSDTVYVNETITLAGDVDTLVVNRTVTTRDTVYNYTEHTEYYTRIDSVYLLGSDYLDDLNRVTSITNELEVEKLSNPYPNPASSTVSIDYTTEVPTTDMFLGVYDSQGRRVEQFPVRPSHTITFDVSDWAPGVYVYMIWSSVGVSSTKRLVVR